MKKWSNEEIKLLMEFYPKTKNEDLVNIFKNKGFDRSYSSLLTKAYKMGISKEYDEDFKTCKLCKRKLPMNTKYFRKDKTYRNGFFNVCKECQGYKFTYNFNGRNEYNTDFSDYSSKVIYDKFPDKVKYFKYKDICKVEKPTSNKITTFICPNCGQEKDMKISSFIHSNFSCKLCGDGISFGEKLFAYILRFNNIEYLTQYSPKWANNKKYDFFIPSINFIIEINGRQHYEEIGEIYNNLKYQIKNDNYKEKLALDNNIENYVRLDCSISEIDYIFNSIKKESKLNFLNLNNINKNICFEEISKSNKIKTKDLFNKGYSTKDISKILHLENSTIRKYLRELTKLGMCNYNGKLNSKNGNGKKIKNTIINKEFNSIVEASNELNISRNKISKMVNDFNNKEWIIL